MGCKSSAKISCYERQGRLPSLKTLFAFEAIYEASAHELFAGFAEEIGKEVDARKHELAKAWGEKPPKSNRPSGHHHISL